MWWLSATENVLNCKELETCRQERGIGIQARVWTNMPKSYALIAGRV